MVRLNWVTYLVGVVGSETNPETNSQLNEERNINTGKRPDGASSLGAVDAVDGIVHSVVILSNVAQQEVERDANAVLGLVVREPDLSERWVKRALTLKLD